MYYGYIYIYVCVCVYIYIIYTSSSSKNICLKRRMAIGDQSINNLWSTWVFGLEGALLRTVPWSWLQKRLDSLTLATAVYFPRSLGQKLCRLFVNVGWQAPFCHRSVTPPLKFYLARLPLKGMYLLPFFSTKFKVPLFFGFQGQWLCSCFLEGNVLAQRHNALA